MTEPDKQQLAEFEHTIDLLTATALADSERRRNAYGANRFASAIRSSVFAISVAASLVAAIAVPLLLNSFGPSTKLRTTVASSAPPDRATSAQRANDVEKSHEASVAREPRPTSHGLGRVVSPTAHRIALRLNSDVDDPKKSSLGVLIEPIGPSFALALGLSNANGALVVSQAIPALADPSLRFGDIVAAINGEPISSIHDLRQRLSSMDPGYEIKLDVWRVGEGGFDFLRALRQLADGGNSSVMHRLGMFYERGTGLARDPLQAVYWLRKSSEAGNPGAMIDLALVYIQGRGIAKNEFAAADLYKKAAALGNATAMNNLAWMLQSGQGVAKDPEEAARLMMQALQRRNEFSYQQMTQRHGAWSPEFRIALQRALRDAGHFTGPLDGQFQEATIAAIDAYVGHSR